MNTLLYITLTVIPMATASCVLLFGVILILFAILEKPIVELVQFYKSSPRDFFVESASFLIVLVILPAWFIAAMWYNSK